MGAIASAEGRINTIGHIATMLYYSALKWKETDTCTMLTDVCAMAILNQSDLLNLLSCGDGKV